MKQKEEKYTKEETGIEEEEESSDEQSNDPFNPEDISIDSKVVPMETYLRRIEQGTINLSPDFQRNEVWTMEKKSQLIESLMLNIPLPMFYVSADAKANYTVVDGLQRLSTIRSFVLGDEFLETRDEKKKGEGFKLQKLEFWEEYNGKTFKELPTNLSNRILETEFRFTVINPGTPEVVKRNIFKRINTGGAPLSAQEIRNALYIGKSTKLLKKLSASKEFKTATGGSAKSLRMGDKELILRLLAFLIRDYRTYKKTINVDSFLSETMIIINAYPEFQSRDYKKLVDKGNIVHGNISMKNLDNLKELFITAMTRSHKLFGKHSFRRSNDGDPRKKQINKSLFEMWGVLLSKLSEKEFALVIENKRKLIKEYKAIIKDYEFEIAISRDSMKHKALKFRFDTIQQLINESKND